MMGHKLPASGVVWLIVGWVGLCLVPWYATPEGFWSFEWTASFLSSESSPAIIQIFSFHRFWIAPLAVFLFLPVFVLHLDKTHKVASTLMLLSGCLGCTYIFVQGFAVGMEGWEWPIMESLFGSLSRGQPGLGYGALLSFGAFLFIFSRGLAARGVIKGDAFVLSCIALMMSLVAIFIFYPVSKVLLGAFYDPSGVLAFAPFFQSFISTKIWGLQCLNAQASCGVAWNSLFLAVLTGVGTTFLGLVFALLISRTGFRAKKLIRITSVLPMITPPFVIGLAVILLFGRTGAVTTFMEWAFHIEPTRWIYGFTGVWLAQLLAFTPIAFLVLTGIVDGISPSMEEASQTLGASHWKTFSTISFPLMRPGIANAFLLGFIESLADFGNPLVLGGNFDVLATEIYFSIAGAQSDQTQAAVLSIALLIFSLFAFYIQRIWLGKKSYVTVSGKGDSGVHVKLPRFLKWSVFSVSIPWVILTLVIYGMIMFGGFVEIWGLNHSLAFRHFTEAFGLEWTKNGLFWSGSAWDSFWTTLKIAAISAPLTAALGLLTSYILVRQKFKGLRLFEFVTMLTFAIPGTVIGVSYILAFNVPPIEITGTGIILVICFLFRNMPVSIRSGIANLSQIDQCLDESSWTLRAGSLRTLRRVILPLIRPAIVSSLVYGFVRAMTSLSAVIFLVSANYDLSTTYIVGRVENGDYGVAIAYSAFLILVMLLILVLIQWGVGERKIGRRKAVHG